MSAFCANEECWRFAWGLGCEKCGAAFCARCSGNSSLHACAPASQASSKTLCPKTDFYRWVNGWWLDDSSITIPPDYPRWGSFVQLHDESLKNQVKLLQQVAAAETKESSSDAKKLGIAWSASLNRFEQWKEGRGDYTPVLEELSTFENSVLPAEWSSTLAKYIARCQQVGIDAPFKLDKEGNLTDAEKVILDIGPSGLSLPSRDYYLTEKFEQQRAMYRTHLANIYSLLTEAGANLDKDFVERVVRFETKLAQITMKKDQSRSYDQYFTISSLEGFYENIDSLAHLAEKDANYADNLKTMSAEELDFPVLTETKYEPDKEKVRAFMNTLYNCLDLPTVMSANYVKNYGVEENKDALHRLMVFDGDYFRRVFTLLLGPHNILDVKAYFQYQIIKSASPFCTKALDLEFFDFYSRKLNGVQEQKTPEKRSVGVINAWLGELLGKIYVEKYFSEADKQNVKAMVQDVLKVMERSLQNNDWLTEQTKQLALRKLEKFVVKIGYPDKWRDYDKLDFQPGDNLFVLQQKVNAFEFQTEFLDKLNSKKDKTKWEMTPQTVNAYFHPMNNEIVFPAAILQPPFYTSSLSSTELNLPSGYQNAANATAWLQAINFGAIGAVIAHEITHGYDDQGRKFDHEGNIKDWWQPADAELFAAKTKLMGSQAEKWSFVEEGENPKTHALNAQLTMGENLADLGGLSLACQGLLNRIGGDAPNRKELLSLFFCSWANVWKGKQTSAYTVQQLATDPHAQTPFRANLVKNLDTFHETFGVTANDAMWLAPEDRVKMW